MAARRLDLAFPTRQGSDPKAWRGLSNLFLPGRPRHVGTGDRVWIRHRDRFVYSYEIQSVVYDEHRKSIIDGHDFGPGPSLLLKAGSGHIENRDLKSVSDPDGVRDTWGRGLRYLSPGARRFVRVGAGGPPRTRLGRLIPPDYGTTEPTEVITKTKAHRIDRVEARLVADFVSWMNGDGILKSLAIPIGRRGDIRADLYNSVVDVLIEAKATSGRNHLRLAVGQLLDYVRHAPPVVGSTPALAVLVPTKPDADLMNYLSNLGIGVIWRRRNGFVDSVNGKYVQRLRNAGGGSG